MEVLENLLYLSLFNCLVLLAEGEIFDHEKDRI
jgi:hypothetical protein